MKKTTAMLLLALMVCLTGCRLMDRILLGERETDPETGQTVLVSPPLIEHVLGPVGAIPGYGGAAVGVIGLLTGLYGSIRKRQEEQKKIGVMAGVEIVRENWDHIETVQDLLRLLKSAPDSKTQRSIDADLEALRAKGVI